MKFWLLIIPFILGSCMEKETVQVPAKVACESVESSFNTAISGSENRLAVDDWVLYEETIAPTAQPETLLLQQIRKIVKLIPVGPPSEKYFEARLFETNITKDKDGNPKTETKEVVEDAPSVYSLCPASNAVSFHGLTSGKSRVDALIYRDRCGALPDCKIAVSNIEFDQLVTFEDGTQEALKYKIVVSSEVPYFGRMLEFCVTQGYEVNGQKIPATRCRRVRNFGFQGE
jgi:hypothetical protein